MSDVVLDANVIVGLLDAGDSLRERANLLFQRLTDEKRRMILLDFLVAEALSALCRRSFERKRRPLNLEPIVNWMQEQCAQGLVHFFPLADDDFTAALDLVHSSKGELNFNDARLVVMQRNGEIGDVASFDADFDGVEGFRRLS